MSRACCDFAVRRLSDPGVGPGVRVAAFARAGIMPVIQESEADSRGSRSRNSFFYHADLPVVLE